MDNQKKMTVTLFKVKEMDCPSEENIIRMKLAELGDDIASLDFDLRKRTLAVTHSESAAARLADAMESVDMGAQKIETRDADAAVGAADDTSQRRVLHRVLLVNAVFFALEMAIGLLSRSMGLVADSLDMLADATVYGMSLMVVGAERNAWHGGAGCCNPCWPWPGWSKWCGASSRPPCRRSSRP